MVIRRRRCASLLLVLALMAGHWAGEARAEDRFPHPEFESGYVMPEEQHAPPRAPAWVYIDTALLALALVAGAVLVLLVRSRRAVFVLMASSLVYFGFVRKGCICPIGSIQNVALGLFDPAYAVPLAALAFFLLPLASTLLFGRVFCASVCPLGALQDLVILKPVRLPRALAEALAFLPVLYLGLAVLFASTGAGFVICRYDPFVAFFRLDGTAGMLLLGAGLLGLGVFVARPYCRFLCPYGVLLGWLSRLSWKHASITPDRCVQCRLCEEACPFDAIIMPEDETPRPDVPKRARLLAVLLLLLPALVAGGGLLFASLSPTLARVHPDVSLAEQLWREDAGTASGTTDASETFRATNKPMSELLEHAGRIRNRFRTGGWILGGFLGLVLGLRLAASLRRRRSTDWEPDRARCLSCARCFSNCPREQLRTRQEIT